MAGRGRASWRLVKIHRNYTVDDAARLLKVCKGTVRRWLKTGLPALTDRKPLLILGDDLADYLKGRAKPRSTCGPAECYCFKCRAPRKAAGAMADFTPLTLAGGNLSALCENCGTLMHRRVSNAQLASFHSILDISPRQAPPHLRDSPNPCVNVHLEKEAENHA
ncbi:MAG: helix-turn-helix domain-containing protein [Alphaproteobacteria bacterium]|nr:helix-turn-helix domain-containing protein [Alphaproteobacteria bacterium]MBU0795807.1 helix-turn-helix domain-containing protein [Alphaproteobacteria bacterium]MBU0886669.1 helix-turn-helix domain-containing protein [Alphaproteobacteria bacterium]MBU1814524.1 helix-turn-helix domain-containing protein [Alphaproteobacteria bacterium]